MWPRSKILSRSSKKIALKYWTQQFGGCGWVGFSRSPPQIFPFLLALREYFQNFHTSSQIHITDYFVNCHFQAVLCYLIYRNLWRRYLFSLSNCFEFEEKIFAAFFLTTFNIERAIKSLCVFAVIFIRHFAIFLGLMLWL